MTSTAAILAELTGLVDTNNPPVDNVTKKLNELAYALPSEGPESIKTVLSNGGYAVVCRAWLFICYTSSSTTIAPGSKQCRDGVLRALAALTTGHAEIIDDVGWQIVTQPIYSDTPEETQVLALKALRQVFIKSEDNRDHFCWNLNMLNTLLSLIMSSRLSNAFLREYCSALTALILNDDRRFACNRAGERKRAIVKANILPILADRLNHPEYENDAGTLNAIVVLLGSCAVSEDVAAHINHGNVLAGIHSIFRKFLQNKILTRNTVFLLKRLCTSAEIKDKVGNLALMKWVAEMIFLYLDDASLTEVILGCIANMTLKNACLASQFIAKSGLQTLIPVMTTYDKNRSIVKLSCIILRNMVDKDVFEGREKVREAGYHEFLVQVLEQNEELRQNYIQPILSELGVLHALRSMVTVIDDEFYHPDRPQFDIPVEPRVGRKSLVLDDFIDD